MLSRRLGGLGRVLMPLIFVATVGCDSDSGGASAKRPVNTNPQARVSEHIRQLLDSLPRDKPEAVAHMLDTQPGMDGRGVDWAKVTAECLAHEETRSVGVRLLGLLQDAVFSLDRRILVSMLSLPDEGTRYAAFSQLLTRYYPNPHLAQLRLAISQEPSPHVRERMERLLEVYERERAKETNGASSKSEGIERF